MSKSVKKLAAETTEELRTLGVEYVEESFVEEFIDDLVTDGAAALRIQKQSYLATYGDLLVPKDIAAKIKAGAEYGQQRTADQADLVLSVSNAARLVLHVGGAVRLISYNQKALSGRNRDALYALEWAGDALMGLGDAIEFRADDMVTVEGRTVIWVRDLLERTISSLESGTWTYPSDETGRVSTTVAKAMRGDLAVLDGGERIDRL